MQAESRSIEKIEDDVKSAGQSFIGLKMEDMLMRIRELDDRILKKNLILEYYENQNGFYDKDFSGTRTRVNSVIRIIKAEKVEYVLEMIDGSDSRVSEEAVAKAKNTLKKIRNNELLLPILE